MADELDTFEEIARGGQPQGQYEPVQRYQDFRAVFMRTEQGRRVLYEIMRWCHMFNSPVGAERVDMGRLAVHAGMHNIGIRLLKTVHEEPGPLPQVQTRTRPEEGR